MLCRTVLSSTHPSGMQGYPGSEYVRLTCELRLISMRTCGNRHPLSPLPSLKKLQYWGWTKVACIKSVYIYLSKYLLLSAHNLFVIASIIITLNGFRTNLFNKPLRANGFGSEPMHVIMSVSWHFLKKGPPWNIPTLQFPNTVIICNTLSVKIIRLLKLFVC